MSYRVKISNDSQLVRVHVNMRSSVSGQCTGGQALSKEPDVVWTWMEFCPVLYSSLR